MPFPSARTAHEAKTKIHELATKGLGIIEDPTLNGPRKKAALGPIEEEIKHWEAEAVSLGYVDAKRKAWGVASMGDYNGGNGGGFIDNYGGPTRKALNRAPNPTPDAEQMAELYEAVKSQKSLRITLKDTSSDAGTAMDQQQAPVMFPGIVKLIHEPVRILDHIPSTTMQGPSVEFITHASTTGTAGMVAAGDLKPEITINTTKMILTAKKLAVYALENDETLLDYQGFAQYLSGELKNQLFDAENNQLLNGDGTGENVTGLLNWSGLLTRIYGAGGETQGLDTVDQAIGDLRVGSSFTDPDTIVMHPTTWHKLRRTKDSQGRYLLNPDPSAEEADTLWGVPVLPTTSIAAGTALVGNLQLAATGLIKEGLTLQTSKANTDSFQRNQTGFIYEERFQLGVERPSALVKVTGL